MAVYTSVQGLQTRVIQRFRYEQFLLFDEKREWYLQLDWGPYEIETSEIYLKAGRDEQALKEVNVETVFRGRC